MIFIANPFTPPGWLYEDELPEGYPYDEMFAHSIVDGVRLFPAIEMRTRCAGDPACPYPVVKDRLCANHLRDRLTQQSLTGSSLLALNTMETYGSVRSHYGITQPKHKKES